jgi:hypothetical protein
MKVERAQPPVWKSHRRSRLRFFSLKENCQIPAKSAQVDYLLMRFKQRLIELPPGLDIVAFIQFDGESPADV